MGKPYKFTPKKQAMFLELVAQGMRRSAAAEQVGVHRTAISYHVSKHPEFAAQLEEAELAACDAVEDALYQAAISGNVVACQVWLYNRSAGRWTDKRQVHTTGDAAMPFQVVIKRDDG